MAVCRERFHQGHCKALVFLAYGAPVDCTLFPSWALPCIGLTLSSSRVLASEGGLGCMLVLPVGIAWRREDEDGQYEPWIGREPFDLSCTVPFQLLPSSSACISR